MAANGSGGKGGKGGGAQPADETGGSWGTGRGLDSGLAKAAPSAEKLTQKSYRSYRRRLTLFSKQCGRRGRETSIEGAFLVLSLLQDSAWEAAEQIDLDQIELEEEPFRPIFRMLDGLYQYEDLIEVPSRCEEFFQEFGRLKNEDLQAYIVRHGTIMRKMREVNVAIPDLLAGWHLLTRAGVPKWTHVQVKSMCGGELEYGKVGQALVRMFGGDSKPNPKDLARLGKDDIFYEDEPHEDAFYQEDDEDWQEALDEDWGDWAEDVMYEEEIPEDVEEAADSVEDAYVNYVESRRRMRDLALSRGFYPVVALGPEAQMGSAKGRGGDGKAKGKGKSKGKGKGKGKSFRRSPMNRRPMSGLRRPGSGNGSSSSSTTGQSEARSTLTGSTASHGPRFKRYRVQSQGMKEVNEEQVTMVEEIAEKDVKEEVLQLGIQDDCYFVNVSVGKAIVDSGASRTIVGEDVWKQWLDKMGKEEAAKISVKQVARDFRFGDGNVVRSNYEVQFRAHVRGQELPIAASIVPGGTPFLVARPTLESWKVKQDYENGMLKIMDSEWFRPERDQKKHYVIDLLERGEFEDKKEDMVFSQLEEQHERSFQIDDDGNIRPISEKHNHEDVVLMMENLSDNWNVEPVLNLEMVEESEAKTEEIIIEDVSQVASEAANASFKDRKLLFWEVYVDEGNISKYFLSHYDDVEVATFSLPEWDFSKKEDIEEFLKLVVMEKPHFVFFAPPCTVWSPMQNLNVIDEIAWNNLMQEREFQEETHLSMVSDAGKTLVKINSDYAVENPDPAASWNTPTWKELDGWDAVCNRCRTGLRYIKNGVNEGKVRKKTRIRTSCKALAKALDLPCTCRPGEHVQMIGKSSALKKMQNYEPKFVKLAAEAIYQRMEENWRRREIAKIFVTEELTEAEVNEEQAGSKKRKVTEMEKEMAKDYGKQALNIVSKLHRQLGHPGNDRLVRALKDAKMNENIVKCGQNYRCDVCEAHVHRRLDKPSSLPQANHFNDVLEMDVFHLKWHGEKHPVLAILDVYSKYETNAVLKREAIKEEIEVLERQWLAWAGVPLRIRTDSSGAHMGEEFQSWCDDYGIQLILVPKDAHHRMGSVERLHAVRRQQLMKMMKEDPSLSLERAVRVACSQRNRLRSIHGVSPAAMVLGYTPEDDGLCDEPSRIRPEGRARHMEDQSARALAAKAFYEANHDATLRRALLSNTRTDLQPLEIGDYGYYWRVSFDKLEPSRWRGPALVCAVEKRTTDNAVLRPDVYWMAHGASLVRVAHHFARREVPTERLARLNQFPQTAAREPTLQHVHRALQPVRGPIRLLDLTGEVPSDHSDRNDQHQDEQQERQSPVAEEPSSNTSPRTTMEVQMPQQQPVLPQEAQRPVLQQEGEQSGADENGKEKGSKTGAHGQLEERKDEEMEAEVDKLFEEIEKTKKRSLNPEDATESAARRQKAEEAFNQARRLEGLPERQATEAEMNTSWNGPQQSGEAIEIDDELLAEEFNEKRLTAEEKKEFDEAKDQALRVWLENDAWKAVSIESADPEETVPARFLLRWKPKAEAKNGKVANARVILQGFRHKDVLTQELETESPTLSRIGKHLIYLYITQKGWKIFSADVKSAFMQSDSIDKETRIFIKPTADMRRRLERLMGLKPFQILKATKPAFGDVRAPRQWNLSADKVMIGDLKFLRHPLDRCVYISYREAYQEDHDKEVFQMNGKQCIVDGLLGLHVDDYIGGGEAINGKHDVEGEYDGNFSTFRDRLCGLSRRFRFGSWDFGKVMRFCGAEIEQSVSREVISVSMNEYVKKIKPITVEKSRKTMVSDACEEKEMRSLRALIGALAWPANQCLPQLSASISILQASVSKPTVKDLNEGNKILRFAKNVAPSFKLLFSKHSNTVTDLRFSVYTDAAWSVRPEGSSQGGFMIFASNEEQLLSGEPMPLTMIDWHSRKLHRMCRSSMAAEAQASAAAVDELEWCKVFWSTMINPMLPIETEQTLRVSGLSYVLTDAKSLFDASKSVTSGMHLNERRTAIEVAIVAERVKVMNAAWKWVNSHQQLADGLTKPAAKDRFAEILSRGNHQMKFDPNFTAAKKVSHADREEQERQLQEAAEHAFGVQIEEEGEKKAGECGLPGCKKAIPDPSSGQKYCCRRHYYAGLHRKQGWNDEWRKVAKNAVNILLLAETPGAMAMRSVEEREEEGWWPIVMAIIVIVMFAGVGVFSVVEKVLTFLKGPKSEDSTEDERGERIHEVVKNVNVLKNEEASVDDEVTEDEPVSEYVEALKNDQANEETYARPSHVDERQRWVNAYEIVKKRPGQEVWMEEIASVIRGSYGPDLQKEFQVRISVEERIRRYCIKHGKNTDATDFSMAIWLEYCNQADLCFLEGALFMKRCWELQKDEVFRGPFKERLVRGELQDKMIQGPTRFEESPEQQQPRFVKLEDRAWGAWYCRHSQDPRW